MKRNKNRNRGIATQEGGKAATREVKQCEKDTMQASKQKHKQAQSSKWAAGSFSTSRARKSRTAENADDEIDSN